MARITRVKPAPLAYPNGGGLKAMAASAGKEKQLELAVHEAQTELNRFRINKKFAAKPASTKGKVSKSPQGRIPKKPEGA